jgi:hypothetical protein
MKEKELKTVNTIIASVIGAFGILTINLSINLFSEDKSDTAEATD